MKSTLNQIVIVGAGGHAKVVIEMIRANSAAKIIGLIDPSPSAPSLLGLPILGGDELLPRLRAQGIEAAFVAIGGNPLRERIGRSLWEMGFVLPAVIHPSAVLSPSARLGSGVVIMAGAIVGSESSVDDLAIINTGAVIDHDNVIGSAAHIAPGCALCGNVRIGKRTLVGVGSSIRPGVCIGDDVIVGAGSAVISDVCDGVSVGGTPAHPIKVGGAG